MIVINIIVSALWCPCEVVLNTSRTKLHIHTTRTCHILSSWSIARTAWEQAASAPNLPQLLLFPRRLVCLRLGKKIYCSVGTDRLCPKAPRRNIAIAKACATWHSIPPLNPIPPGKIKRERRKIKTVKINGEYGKGKETRDTETGWPQWLGGYTASLPPTRTGFDPRPVHSGFSQMGIVPDDAVGRRVFSGIFRFSRPFTPALLHTHLTPPPSIGSQDLAAESHSNLFTYTSFKRKYIMPKTNSRPSYGCDMIHQWAIAVVSMLGPFVFTTSGTVMGRVRLVSGATSGAAMVSGACQLLANCLPAWHPNSPADQSHSSSSPTHSRGSQQSSLAAPELSKCGLRSHETPNALLLFTAHSEASTLYLYLSQVSSRTFSAVQVVLEKSVRGRGHRRISHARLALVYVANRCAVLSIARSTSRSLLAPSSKQHRISYFRANIQSLIRISLLQHTLVALCVCESSPGFANCLESWNLCYQEEGESRRGLRLLLAVSPYFCSLLSPSVFSSIRGIAVAERLDCSPPTKANRVRSPAQSPLNFCKWESYRTMPIFGGFSRGSSVSPNLAFRRCSILTSVHPHRL
ncbi:hypothetical protein PR048_023992 [Dryococelus australis]|uniref:Uncharacterized protein n=1 Tax=Dryococelus australis TaxID=614101 RepID=A0ABQ9GVQ3_9NEOP|nr:hypothetical protein PR048_023992 [Dryococelus australis]